MSTAAQERNVLGRIWNAQYRIEKLRNARAKLVEEITAACIAGNLERAYDYAEATTRIDVQLKKAQADLKLWKSLR